MLLKPVRLCTSLFILCLLASPLSAENILLLDDDLSHIKLSSFLRYYEDKSGLLTYEDVRSRKDGVVFSQMDGKTKSLGYSRSIFWFTLQCKNLNRKPVKWLLEQEYPLIDKIEVYINNKGNIIRYTGGDKVPFEHRQIDYRSFVFPIETMPGDSDMYIKIQSTGSLVINLSAWSPRAFNKKMTHELIFLWIYYGIMIALIFYNLVIFFSFKDRAYLYLVLFIFGISLYSMTQNGIAFQYLWPESIKWAHYSNPFFIFFSGLAALLFTKNFLNLDKVLKPANVLTLLAIGLNAIFLISVFVVDYFIVTQISVVYVICLMTIFMGIGFIAAVKRQREAYFYFGSWILFLIGSLFFATRAFGLTAVSSITNWTYQIGSSVLVLLLSFGIADKINMFRKGREEALQALQESEEKYRVLIENAHDGILLIVDERPVYANSRMISMAGMSENEFYSKRLAELFPDTPTGKEMVMKQYTNRHSGKAAASQYEAQMYTADKKIIEVIISAALTTIKGKSASIAIITDVSDLKKAENTIQQQFTEIQDQCATLEELNAELSTTHEELLDVTDKVNQEKEHLAATLRSIGDAVISCDREGRVVLLNKVAEILTGWSQEEAFHTHIGDVVDLKDERAKELFFSNIEFIRDMGNPDTIGLPFSMRSKNGTEHIVEINSAPILVEGDDVVGMVLAIRDITEKSKLEKEIMRISKMESLSVLAGGIAHDFNNLLTGIIGNISIAKTRTNGSHEIIDLLDKVEHAGKRAVNLTRQLLTFSKGGEPIKDTVSIGDLIHDSVDFILAGSSIACTINLEDDLWPVEIDAGQISQVFSNMIINAMQAMPGGGSLIISARNIMQAPANIPLMTGEYVQISITDNGCGIPFENLSKIFDPYFTTKKTGSGLGLASSYSIIKRHGGYIDVISTPKKGTTFSIYLKKSNKEVTPSLTLSDETGKHEGRILLMDDEDYILEVAEKMFRHLGYSVVKSKDGAQAVEIYREYMNKGNTFDLVIIDLTIPGGMGGAQTIRELRKIDPDVRAVVSSGYSDDKVMANYREYGFNAILVKPYQIQDIDRMLKSIS